MPNQWSGNPWNETTDAQLRKLWMEKVKLSNGQERWLYASEIGDRMHMTKNAIIGRVHRLGLPPRKMGHHRFPSEIPTPPKLPKPKPEPLLKLQENMDEQRIHALMRRYF